MAPYTPRFVSITFSSTRAQVRRLVCLVDLMVMVKGLSEIGFETQKSDIHVGRTPGCTKIIGIKIEKKDGTETNVPVGSIGRQQFLQHARV